jgi:hypothetical protein
MTSEDFAHLLDKAIERSNGARVITGKATMADAGCRLL